MTHPPQHALWDFTPYLWLLKLGALVNLYFLAHSYAISSGAGASHAHLIVPAQILFAVSAFRCLFPVRYKDNVVFHDSPLSSIFLTRLLATFAEVAFIYQFSHVIRVLNVDHVGWIDALSWWMVVQVVISQGFVWGSILTHRLALFYYEELGWAIIFVANTIASAYLYATVDAPGAGEILLQLNLLFGAVYLPWQVIHLRSLRSDATADAAGEKTGLAAGLRQSVHVRNRRTSAEEWGGIIGLTWMVSYWATWIPLWVHVVVRVLAAG